MRLGVTFSDMVSDLRSEIGRSSDLGHGISDEPRLKRAINAAYFDLYDEYDWPHLNRVFDRVTMAAGSRYYDFPTGLDFTRVEQVRAWWNGVPTDIEKGIGTKEYATFDSDSDERSDPVLRWDLRYEDFASNATQFEVWPVPASANTTIEFKGAYKMSELVNDADVCILDAEIVILRAAIDLVGKDEKQRAEQKAQRRLFNVRRRMPDGARVRIGLGEADRTPKGRAVVRIS